MGTSRPPPVKAQRRGGNRERAKAARTHLIELGGVGRETRLRVPEAGLCFTQLDPAVVKRRVVLVRHPVELQAHDADLQGTVG